MKKFVAGVVALVATGAAVGGSVVTVEPSVVVGEASPDLWGKFLEDIDLALDGGEIVLADNP